MAKLVTTSVWEIRAEEELVGHVLSPDIDGALVKSVRMIVNHFGDISAVQEVSVKYLFEVETD